MSKAHLDTVDREARWMERYGLRKSKADPCLRWVAGGWCRCSCLRCGTTPAGRLAWFDHTYPYLGAGGLRVLVTQPYWLEPDRVQEALEAAQAHGVYVAAHTDRGAAWWFRDTRLVVFSNKPIPAHGYRFDYAAWETDNEHC